MSTTLSQYSKTSSPRRGLSMALLGMVGLIITYFLWPNPPTTREFAFKTSDSTHVFNLKVATTGTQHARGLMFVESMPENEGMVFVHEVPQVSRFWMKDTYIPLDIVFIDEFHKITHIHENAKPLDESIISHDNAAKYIVELNGGICKKLGIAVGHKLFPHN